MSKKMQKTVAFLIALFLGCLFMNQGYVIFSLIFWSLALLIPVS